MNNAFTEEVGSRSSISEYSKDVSRYERIDREKEKDLSRRVLEENDIESAKRLAEANLPLAILVARGFMGKGISFEDLVGYSNLGLVKASQGYDWKENTAFSTYSDDAMKNEIRKVLQRKRSIGPNPQWRAVKRLKHYQSLAGNPDSFEPIRKLAVKNGEKPSAIDRMKSAYHVLNYVSVSSISLEDSTDFYDSFDPEEDLDSEDGDLGYFASPSQNLIKIEDINLLKDSLALLDERSAEIVDLYFGLSDGNPLPHKDIGIILGLTRERVRQIYNEAVEKLEKFMTESTSPNKMSMLEDKINREIRQKVEDQDELVKLRRAYIDANGFSNDIYDESKLVDWLRSMNYEI